jgi:hypothetical protein
MDDKDFEDIELATKVFAYIAGSCIIALLIMLIIGGIFFTVSGCK